MTRVWCLTSFFVLISASGCRQTDLNQPCVLKKRNPDGGSPIAILEGDLLKKAGSHKDFISRTVDCDQSFCVRDSEYKTDAGADSPATGYCSAQCDLGVPNNCPSYDEALDRSSKKLNCRVLLLDVETLAALANSDGGAAGNIREPFFCARTPDAG